MESKTFQKWGETQLINCFPACKNEGKKTHCFLVPALQGQAHSMWLLQIIFIALPSERGKKITAKLCNPLQEKWKMWVQTHQIGVCGKSVFKFLLFSLSPGVFLLGGLCLTTKQTEVGSTGKICHEGRLSRKATRLDEKDRVSPLWHASTTVHM